MEERLHKVEVSLGMVRDTQDRIADSLERLVRLETMHAETRSSLDRAFRATERVAADIDEKLETIDTRLRAIEDRQPVTNLAVYFVGLLALGALATIGTAIVKMIGLGTAP
ncbi:hypothetical protein [Methylibium sp.]|uniref:hypothetical protein n=1 Tax=Methylibium sp. TaxID=2067992 RepID=UPI00333FC440